MTKSAFMLKGIALSITILFGVLLCLWIPLKGQAQYLDTILVENRSFELDEIAYPIPSKPIKKSQNGFLIWLFGKKNAASSQNAKDVRNWIAGWGRCDHAHPPKARVYSNQTNNLPSISSDGRNALKFLISNKRNVGAITQQLTKPLKKGVTYQLRFDAAKSFNSLNDQVNNKDIIIELLIWGGDHPCESEELLVVIKSLNQCEWMEYEVDFSPSQPWKYLTIQPHYSTQIREPNQFEEELYIDNFSHIYQVSNKALERFRYQVMPKDTLFKEQMILSMLHSKAFGIDKTHQLSKGKDFRVLQDFLYQYNSYGLYRAVVGQNPNTLESLKRVLSTYEQSNNWFGQFEKMLELGRKVEAEGLTTENEILIQEYSKKGLLVGYDKFLLDNFIVENRDQLYEQYLKLTLIK